MFRMVTTLGLVLAMTACAAPEVIVPASSLSSAPPPTSVSPAVTECSPSHPIPSEIVELYFPCGAPAELRPIVRGLSSSGDDIVAEVVRLYLEGPNAREREAGFGSLLSPGNIDIVEMADGRLVLDFPAEVGIVSTSNGSRTVLEGLRLTLMGLDGVEEIELRLRNDCAAFFEWIQVGPTCHLLTDEGLIERPMPSASAAADIPTIPSTPTGPEITTGTPVTAEDDDGTFRLTLEVGQERYRAGQPIRVMATLIYLGPDATIQARGPGTGLIGFGVESDDPAILIGPAFTSDCAPWPFTRGEVVEYPFGKSGGYGEDEPLAPFYRSYFGIPELRLPAGTWRIFAGGGFYTGPDCGEAFPHHELTTSVTVIVEP